MSLHFKKTSHWARNVPKAVKPASAFEKDSVGEQALKVANRGHGWIDLQGQVEMSEQILCQNSLILLHDQNM